MSASGRVVSVNVGAPRLVRWRNREVLTSIFKDPVAGPPGAFGENLTVAGVAVTDAVIGERWRVNDVLLEVSKPRTPCYKLGIRMSDDTFPRRFVAAGRPGAYLRILSAGTVTAGDSIIIESRPEHGMTIQSVAASRKRCDRLARQ